MTRCVGDTNKRPANRTRCPSQDLDKPDWQDDDDIYPPEGDEDAIEPEQPPIEDAAEDEDAAGSSRKRKKKKKKKSGDTMETPVVDMSEMDADAQFQMPSSAPVEEEWDGTEEMRKRVLDQYMDEIYKMDFNDMVCACHLRAATYVRLHLPGVIRSETCPPVSNTRPWPSRNTA